MVSERSYVARCLGVFSGGRLRAWCVRAFAALPFRRRPNPPSSPPKVTECHVNISASDDPDEVVRVMQAAVVRSLKPATDRERELVESAVKVTAVILALEQVLGRPLAAPWPPYVSPVSPPQPPMP